MDGRWVDPQLSHQRERFGHRDVDQHNVGPQRLHECSRRLATMRAADDLHAIVRYDGGDALRVQFDVSSDNDADGTRLWCSHAGFSLSTPRTRRGQATPPHIPLGVRNGGLVNPESARSASNSAFVSSVR